MQAPRVGQGITQHIVRHHRIGVWAVQRQALGEQDARNHITGTDNTTLPVQVRQAGMEPYKPSAPLFQHNNKRCKGMEEGQHPSITLLYPTRKTSIVKNKFDTLIN